MNIYKLRAIMEFIRKQGGLPIDGVGRKLTAEETLIWYGLDELLTTHENRKIKEELLAMAEAEELMERVRLGVQQ